MQMVNYFTSDLHFGHTNIIEYCKRPYKDANEMDEDMYANLAMVVPPNATLWVLGDLAMKGKENAEKVAARLAKMPFRIRIIAGNHDKGRMEIYTRHNLMEHREGRHLYVIDGRKVSMGHYPVEGEPEDGVLYLHGHVHEAFKFQLFGTPLKQGINCNVGVDVWGMKPVTLDTIVEERDNWFNAVLDSYR